VLRYGNLTVELTKLRAPAGDDTVRLRPAWTNVDPPLAADSDRFVNTPIAISDPLTRLPENVSGPVIHAQLRRILASTSFANSERLSRLLRFTVESAAEGRVDQLKEYALAISVFDKRNSFDPRFDPIVRVEAGRLRNRLKQYYENEGRDDAVIIDLPKGSYAPRFISAGANREKPREDGAGAQQDYSANWIAVLPFADHSPGADQEYFCDGMTEELINALTKLPGLRVAALNSALRLRGKADDYRKVAEQLKVGSIVAGSVRKAGNRLRITVQLIDTSNGCYLWSEIYDRQIEDVFAIQEGISRAIVAKLKLQIADGQSSHLVRRYTGSLDAYTLYLKGRHCWNQRSEQGLRKAVEFFEQTIELDPRYAPAFSGLADSYALLGNSGAAPPKSIKAKAMQAALKAVELDATLAEAHATLGHVRATYCWDWPGACTEYKLAMALNPAYATVHHWYAITYLAPLGLLENARTEIQKAEELDPLSASIKRDIAVILCNGRLYEQAIEQCRKTIELEPAFQSSYWALGLAYEGTSQYDKAVVAFQQALKNSASHTPRFLGALGHAYAQWGKQEDASKVLEEMDKLSRTRYVSPFDFAMIHLGLNNSDTAFAWLERALKARCYELVFLQVDARFDAVRSDLRFARLLKRLGLQIRPSVAV
jgi:TolB-like protein/lipoprotein NlpI